MKLDISASPSEQLIVSVNGKTAAQIAVCEVLALPALLEEVREARAVTSLVRTLPGQIEELTRMTDKDAPQGLMDGLLGITMPMPSNPGVPEIATVHTAEARRAYEIGSYLRTVIGYARPECRVRTR